MFFFVFIYTNFILFYIYIQLTKANFWFQHNFHGVDLNALRNAALKEYLYQPVVDTFDIRICIAKSNKYSVDFLKAHENDLHTIDIPLKFKIMQTDEIHGLAFWFDVAFFGSQQSIWLSTAPTQPLTHWYQVRNFTSFYMNFFLTLFPSFYS